MGLLRGDRMRSDGSGTVAKWTQTLVGRHHCAHSGQLLHVNYISDTLRSGRNTSTAEQSKVRRHHPVAHFRSNSHPDSGTNQYRWSTFTLLPRRTPFVNFRLYKRRHIPVLENICTHPNFQFGCFSLFFPYQDSELPEAVLTSFLTTLGIFTTDGTKNTSINVDGFQTIICNLEPEV